MKRNAQVQRRLFCQAMAKFGSSRDSHTQRQSRLDESWNTLSICGKYMLGEKGTSFIHKSQAIVWRTYQERSLKAYYISFLNSN